LAVLAIAIGLTWPRGHASAPPAAIVLPQLPPPHAQPAVATSLAPAEPAQSRADQCGDTAAAAAAPPPPAPPPRPAPVLRTVAHPAAKRIAPSPPPATKRTVPPPAPPPHAVPRPAVDCNPPYYYDGTKKIFKPTCV